MRHVPKILLSYKIYEIVGHMTLLSIYLLEFRQWLQAFKTCQISSEVASEVVSSSGLSSF